MAGSQEHTPFCRNILGAFFVTLWLMNNGKN